MSGPRLRGEDLVAAYRAERSPAKPEVARLWNRLEADLKRPGARREAIATPRRCGAGVTVAAVGLVAAAALVWWWPAPETTRGGHPPVPSLASDRAQPRPVKATTPEREPARAQHNAVTPQVQQAPAQTRPVPDTRQRERTAADATPHRPIRTSRIERPPPIPPRRTETGPTTAKSSVSAVSGVDELAQETELLRQARAAMSRGQTTEALAILQTYDERFATGRLTEERDAVRTIARCRITPSAAPKLTAAFVDGHADSLFAAQVRAACVATSGDAP